MILDVESSPALRAFQRLPPGRLLVPFNGLTACTDRAYGRSPQSNGIERGILDLHCCWLASRGELIGFVGHFARTCVDRQIGPTLFRAKPMALSDRRRSGPRRELVSLADLDQMAIMPTTPSGSRGAPDGVVGISSAG